MKLTPIQEYQKLKGLVPDGDIGKKTLAVIKADCNIKTDIELAMFMGQFHTETGGGRVGEENLRYSAEGLMKTFKKYFPTIELAKAYEFKPEMIANRVYANRMGNGNELSGDGWKHRGFGGLQLTGKDNQYAFANYVLDPQIKVTPSLIATKYFFRSADYYFDKNGLWKYCATLSDESITKLSKAVNIGNANSPKTPHGLADRIKYTYHYHKLLTT